MTTNTGQLTYSMLKTPDTQDTFPTHDSKTGRGGLRTVSSLVERDALITTYPQYLDKSMEVWVDDGINARIKYILNADKVTWTQAINPTEITSSTLTIQDVGNYYTATNLEGALQEAGKQLSVVNSLAAFTRPALVGSDVITNAGSVTITSASGFFQGSQPGDRVVLGTKVVSNVVVGPVTTGSYGYPYIGTVQSVSPDGSSIQLNAAVPNTQTGLPGWVGPDVLSGLNQAILKINNQGSRASFGGGEVFIPKGDWLISALPTNPLGKSFVGPGRLFQITSQGLKQLNSTDSSGGFISGREYGRTPQLKARGRTSSVIIVSTGDSTRRGDNISDTRFLFQNFLPNLLQDRGVHLYTVTNNAVSGTGLSYWLSAPGLQADMSLNPDVYCIPWGINDAPYDDLAQFSTNLEAGLSIIRGAGSTFVGTVNGGVGYDKGPGNLCIILETPYRTYDIPNNRDDRWYENCRQIILALGKKYQCVVIDKTKMFSNPIVALGWDNPYGDGRTVHPPEEIVAQVYGLIADVICGENNSVTFRDNSFRNVAGFIFQPVPTSPPNFYANGLTYNRATTADGWPYDGYLITEQHSDGIARQISIPFVVQDYARAERLGQSNVWKTWQYTQGEKDFITAPAITGATTSGTNTYSRRGGRYSINNNILTGRVVLFLSAKDSAMAGQIIITGLPNGANIVDVGGQVFFPVATFSNITLGTGYTSIYGQITTAQSTIQLYKAGSGLASTPLLPADLTNTSQIAFSFEYPMLS